MSVAHLTELVRESIYHLTTVLDGKFSLCRYNEIFRTSISTAENLGKPYNADPTLYTAHLAKSLRSFFEDPRDDRIRVVHDF